MNLRNIIILIIIIVFLISYLNDEYSKNKIMVNKTQEKKNQENNKLNKVIKQNFNIHEDPDDLYINTYLLNNEVVPNVIKKYMDEKINIISNYQGSGKNIYDNVISQANNTSNNNTSNNNANKNNLLHFINFLI